MFMAYSFLGWIFESICCSFIQKKPVFNRGFLIGPICPIYGYGAVFLIVLLKKYYDDPVALFVMAVVGASILEYITSYIMEKIFHARWWDYTDRRFNLNGRICLGNAILFGILGLCLMYYINPFYESIISNLSPYLLEIISISIFILYLVDNIITFIIMFELRSNFGLMKKDATEEISEQVKLILNKNRVFKLRIMNAFPNMKILGNKELTKKLLPELRKRNKKK